MLIVYILCEKMFNKSEITSLMDDLIQDVLLNVPDEYRIGEVSSEHAFDYDGCIGNDCDEKLTPEELVEAEAEFWAYVRDVMHAETRGLPNDRRCVSIATARQSKPCDDYNTENNNSTSCFPLYLHVSNYLDAQIDKFLLADLNGLTTGTSFERALDPDYAGEHTNWCFDESKITLLYAKMHRSALCNPNGLALFTFYDDRKDILQGLHHFFTKNKDLLPPNLILNLCQFQRGGKVCPYRPIFRAEHEASLGFDYSYKETTKALGEYLDTLANRLNHGVPLDINTIHRGIDLGRWIRRIRAPEEQEKLQVGSMIFKRPDVEVTREGASCSLEKMLGIT